jgi:hypothetical protein
MCEFRFLQHKEKSMKKLQQWLKQPTSVAGLAALLGTLSALLSHQLTWVQAGPLVLGAIASVALPDNSAIKSDAGSIAGDAYASTNMKKGMP